MESAKQIASANRGGMNNVAVGRRYPTERCSCVQRHGIQNKGVGHHGRFYGMVLAYRSLRCSISPTLRVAGSHGRSRSERRYSLHRETYGAVTGCQGHAKDELVDFIALGRGGV